ncbi:MAG: methyl-accepting chemotaxis protein [Myxococcota bacterium]|nr:methyl-accepting chemotaxis protein [Myxococcota bacterium]
MEEKVDTTDATHPSAQGAQDQDLPQGWKAELHFSALRDVTQVTLNQKKDAVDQVLGVVLKTHFHGHEARIALKKTEEHLKEMIEKAVEVSMSNEMVYREFSDFTAKATDIENILFANWEITGQIKVLALNAGIQSAKAGEEGSGFGVVARELRTMATGAERNLNDIRELADYLTTQAKQSTETIGRNSEVLNTQMDALGAIEERVTRISDHMTEVLKEIQHAIAAIKSQRSGIEVLERKMPSTPSDSSDHDSKKMRALLKTAIQPSTAEFNRRTDMAIQSIASARTTTDQILKHAQKTEQQLDRYRQEFVEVVMSTDMTQFEFTDFATKATSIEDILSVNQDTAGYTQVLTTNANIQAAKIVDPKRGPRFRLVAREMRKMNRRTADSLKDLYRMADYLRVLARQSAESIALNSHLVHAQMDLIEETMTAISQATRNLEDVASNIADIHSGIAE